MSSLEKTVSSDALVAVPRPPRTWYFLGSALFGGLAVLVSVVVGLATLMGLMLWHGLGPTTSTEQVVALMRQGGWVYLGAIVASPFMIAVLWGAVWIAQQRLTNYLALSRPSGKELARGLAMIFALLLVWSIIGYLAGQKTPQYLINDYRSAKEYGWLYIYLIALCLAAPITEEFLVRGFLFRGWSQSFLRPIGAIALGSAVWTALHTQYNWFYLSEIFTIGLLLGYLRYRSGSIWLTVVIHAVINLTSLIEVALIVAYT